MVCLTHPRRVFCTENPNPVRRTLHLHSVFPTAPDISLDHARGVRVADNRPAFASAAPPSYAEHMASSATDIQQAGQVVDGEMEPEVRWARWAMFLIGNAISTAVVIYEMTQLAVCFDGFVGELDGELLDSADIADQVAFDASLTRDIVMFALGYSLLAEVVSVIALSVTYRSPLDMKSVHKVPPNDVRNCCASMNVFFLAPFSWALIYLLGGTASIYYSLNSSCEGQGGSYLELYLQVSGVIMVFGGVLFLGVSVFSVWLACEPCRAAEGCYRTAREAMNKRILKKGLFIDTFWILQGVVWSYRTGAFAQDVSVLLGVFSVLGEGLAAFGSVALDVVICWGGLLQ